MEEGLKDEVDRVMPAHVCEVLAHRVGVDLLGGGCCCHVQAQAGREWDAKLRWVVESQLPLQATAWAAPGNVQEDI